MFAAVALMMMTSMALAADGAALYKTKCAACHGAAGEGKGTTPAIKGSTKVVSVVTTGGLKGIHAKPVAGVTADDAAAIATFLK
jgi:mono/diheme cytochrome c family protein